MCIASLARASGSDLIKSAQRAHAIKASSVAVLGCFAIILGLSLFMPKRDIPPCVHIVPLVSTATIQYNCDSLLIAQAAADLDAYLTEPSMWRTRPVHIFFVSGVGRILDPFTSRLTHHIVNRVPDLESYIPNARGLLQYYYAGLLFNVLVVALAYFATIRALPALSPSARVGVAGAIASFDITLAWFWIPHQIIMNLLVPIGGLVAFLIGLRLRRFTRLPICIFGSVTALFTLAYPYALIWPVTLCLGGIYGWRKWTAPGTGEAITRLSVYVAGFGSFMLAWFLPYLLVFGEAASHEANLGQFRWVPAALQEGEVLRAIISHIELFVRSLSYYAGVYGLVLLLVLVTALVALARVRSLATLRDPIFLGAGATLLVMMLFNFLQGYHPGRLLLFPILLLVIATSRALLLMGAYRTAVGYLVGVTATQVALGYARSALSQE